MPRNLDPHLSMFEQRLLRGALVVLPDQSQQAEGQDPTGDIWVLRFQYNPETITRTRSGVWKHARNHQAHPAPQERTLASGHRGGGLYAESETVQMKLVFDATELNLRPGASSVVGRAADFVLDVLSAHSSGIRSSQAGVLPELAVLELIATAKETREDSNRRQGGRNALQPVRPTDLLLVLGPRRFPVVLTQLTITEKRFDSALVPVRAECDVKLRVLESTEITDNPFASATYAALLRQRDGLAGQAVYTEPGGQADLDTIIARAVAPRES